VPLIELENLSRRFAGAQAVDRLSLAVEEAEVLALLGPSGCGKTTALRLIAGFEVPDGGRIRLRGRVIAGDGVMVPPEERGVGIVFQDYALFPHLTVADNIAFGLAAWERGERRRRVRAVLDLVGLGAVAGRHPHELSGGQQQRMGVAGAVAPAPAILLLDEPFSNLDTDLRVQMREEIGRILRETETTTIFVTHDQEEAFAIADRVGVLNGGRLEQIDTPEGIYHAPASPFVARFVGAADFVPGTVTPAGVRTELGVFPRADDTAVGAPVDVMIRPDDIDFTVDPQGEAVVVSRQFRGPENLYRLRLPSGRVVHSVQSSTTVYPAGTQVRLSTTLLHVVVYPAPASPIGPGQGPADAPSQAVAGVLMSTPVPAEE
jgi:iron(III) transport system ATP-binding protein